MSDTPENDPSGRNGLTPRTGVPVGNAGEDEAAKRALSDLDRRVRDAVEVQKTEQAAEEALIAKAEATRESGAAWRIIIDLVAATGLLGGLGYALDVALGWSPLGLLTGLLGGFALGMWLAARRALAIQARKP